MRLVAYGLFAVYATVAACGPSSPFLCVADGECVDGDRVGTCDASGFCAFPDGACPSGQRFGEHAGGGFGGECVPTTVDTDVGSTGSVTSDPSTTTLGSASDPTTNTNTNTSTNADPTTDDPSTTSDTTPGGCPPGWDDCGHPLRRAIVLAGGPGDVVDFPVRVEVDAALVGAEAIADPAALRFGDGAGTILPFDLETPLGAGPDPRQPLAAWVRMPPLSVESTVVFLYYGGRPLTAPAEGSGVWSADFIEVWHLDGSGGVVGDRAFDTTDVDYDSGLLGAAAHFNTTDSRLVTPTLPVFPPTVTLSAWIRPDSWGEADFGRVFDSRNGPGGGRGFSLLVAEVELNLRTVGFVMGCGNGDAEWVGPDDAIALDTWQHVAVTFGAEANDPVPVLYVDGVQLELEQVFGPQSCQVQEPLDRFAIGNIGDALSRAFEGRIDEARVSSVPRDPTWIAYEHASAQPGFVSFGEATGWE